MESLKLPTHDSEDVPLLERRLPNSTVEYMLFLLESQKDKADSLLTELEAVRKTAFQMSDKLTGEYIWQRDSFNLQVKSEQGLTFLYGRTDYGDSVEDEWLIVHLLVELSKAYDSLWVRVFDSDGEFLFIEAAAAVPKWLDPEFDAHRAWIHRGQLRIISSGLTDPQKAKSRMTLATAVETIIKADEQTVIRSPLVEAEAFYRLEKYPGEVARSLHHSLTTIPRRLAAVLHDNPRTIAPAVEAFYLRNPLSMKVFSGALQNQLKLPPRDLVTVSVRFTKVLFAQLRSQQFPPPPAWAGPISSAGGDQKKLAMLDVGMKLTCGFELLAATAEASTSGTVQAARLALAEDGDAALPSDGDMQSWEGVSRDDDDSWLDVNYDDFVRELQGGRGALGPDSAAPGMGDAGITADLRKIVSRFEAFLNDETAGVEGAEVIGEEDEEEDDEDSDEDEGDSGGEDKDVSFDEDQFAHMIREMMGLPPAESSGAKNPGPLQGDDGSEDDGGVEKLTVQMEAELRSHGALATRHTAPLDAGVSSLTNRSSGDMDDSEDEEVNIDYNLAKNLLESFKSQGGMTGPAGNILGMMGLALPRDEDNDDDDNDDLPPQRDASKTNPTIEAKK